MAMFGDTLRQARAHKGVTLKEAEQATRINRHHLAALEDENFSALPPPIYQRGIVRNYAVYLDLDPARLLAMFEEAHGDAAPLTNDPVTAMRPLDMPSHWAPNFAIIAFAVVLSAIVFAWVYSAYVAPSGASPTATQIVATVTPFANDVALPTEAPPTKAPATKAPNATTPPQATTAPATQPADRNALSDTTQPRRTQPTPTPTAKAETTQASSGVIEQGGDNQKDQPADTSGSGSTVQSNTQATQNPAQSQQTQQPQQTQSGEYVTGITITASADIYLEVTADGVSVYAGNLPSGQSTQQFVGSNFNVYTTSGQNTVFTNSCGATFQMGYETGEANYVLSANAESCNPNQ